MEKYFDKESIEDLDGEFYDSLKKAEEISSLSFDGKTSSSLEKMYYNEFDQKKFIFDINSFSRKLNSKSCNIKKMSNSEISEIKMLVKSYDERLETSKNKNEEFYKQLVDCSISYRNIKHSIEKYDGLMIKKVVAKRTLLQSIFYVFVAVAVTLMFYNKTDYIFSPLKEAVFDKNMIINAVGLAFICVGVIYSMILNIKTFRWMVISPVKENVYFIPRILLNHICSFLMIFASFYLCKSYTSQSIFEIVLSEDMTVIRFVLILTFILFYIKVCGLVLNFMIFGKTFRKFIFVWIYLLLSAVSTVLIILKQDLVVKLLGNVPDLFVIVYFIALALSAVISFFLVSRWKKIDILFENGKTKIFMVLFAVAVIIINVFNMFYYKATYSKDIEEDEAEKIVAEESEHTATRREVQNVIYYNE